MEGEAKGEYLKMTGDNEAALFAARHVIAKLVLWGQCKEISGETGHFRYEFGVNAVVNDLEDAPFFTSPHNLLTYLRSTATGLVVNPGQRDHRNFVAKLVVCHIGTLVFIANEARPEGLLVGYGSEAGNGSHDRN